MRMYVFQFQYIVARIIVSSRLNFVNTKQFHDAFENVCTTRNNCKHRFKTNKLLFVELQCVRIHEINEISNYVDFS